jgi:peptidoglycan/xylan/chitin deacetylase (PgdA/CDA1 family)
MTFDDGPSNFTVGLLDFLKSLDVHATFFLTPASGGKEHIEVPTSHYFNIVKRMIDDGHQIGSHTWSHQDLDAISREDRLEQMHKTETALSSILGFFPTYMRAPYLNCGPDCQDDMDAVTGLGYHVVNIDLDTYDWKRNYDDAKRNFRDGNGQFPGLSQSPHGSGSFITLSHDIFEETVEDLVPFMMKIVKEYGYTPVTVGECLEDPPENWYRDPVTGKAAGPSRS